MSFATKTSKELKALCAEHGLAKSGKKSVLVERLTAALATSAVATENVASNAPAPAKSPAVGKRAERYQKVEQREHILMRPDTYVGSVHEQPLECWVFDAAAQSLVPKEVSVVPALFKIFDEILVNASDNKQRDPRGMTSMRVVIDAEAGTISVRNNGRGVPIEMHEQHGMYVPELIFGNLLTSDNYDDAHDKRTTGGRNGFGAKLTNIFSTSFTVETADSRVGKRYTQTWSANMTEKTVPEIESYSGEDFTQITFTPDLAKFSLSCITPDMLALLTKRVYDIAGVTDKSLRVWLNGEKLAIKCFEQYVGMCRESLFKQASTVLAEGAGEKRIAYCRVNDRWEIAICASDGQFRQVSFVNSINTSKGGSHVKHVTDCVIKHLMGVLKKKNKKGAKISKNNVKNYLCVFVSCLIENPAFDSQTKETLNTQVKKFGSECTLSDKFLKSICKADVGIVDLVLQDIAFKSRKIAPRASKTRNLTGIPKLDDANKAGTSKSQQCSLILTEGDSAKALAMSGLSVVGRDFYGVYPLKGKLLNVREARFDQVNKNKEIQNVIKILNIKRDKDYTTADARKSLRYGSVIIMADQDHDGSHIKGLVINFLQWFNPSLVRAEGFVRQFITPIVKASLGRGAAALKSARSFYTLPQFEQWREELSEKEQRSLTTKYYKGLGTSTAKEAKEYFSALDSHLIPFVWQDGDEDSIGLAFDKSRANDRKDWLRAHEAGTFVDYQVDAMEYGNFFNNEFILYSIASNKRAIPSVVDGLKPSQRKVLYACFKRKLTKDIKVAQLAGYISEHAAYHHGEASLQKTIVGMAQDFVGANNINLLVPSGQFGTRSQGGEDQASPRYIFTRLAKIARKIFHPDDDAILTALDDDGVTIEPEFYVPIIPMALVNGSDGIGTGWSTKVPMFSPREIIANLRKMIDDGPEACEPMTPWYRDFKGTIVGQGQKFIVKGACDYDEEDKLLCVSELPIGTWTQKYKEALETKLTPSVTKHGRTETQVPALVKEFQEHHTDRNVDFRITLTENAVRRGGVFDRKCFKDFGLLSSISMSNMVMWNAKDKITAYGEVEQIMKDFYDVRILYYDKRKAHLLKGLSAEQTKLSNRARFIEMFIDGEIDIGRRAESAVAADLDRLNFVRIHSEKVRAKAGDAEVDAEEAAAALVEGAAGYDYLLSMSLRSLTEEKVTKLLAQVESLDERLSDLRESSPEDLWLTDLDDLVLALDESDATRAKETAEMDAARAKAQRGRGKAPKRKATSKPVVFDESDWVPKPKSKPRAKKKVAPRAKKTGKSTSAPKRKAASISVVDEVADQLQSLALQASPSTKPPKSKRAAARATPKAMREWEIDSDESGDESDFVDAAPVVPRSRSQRARPAVSYNPQAIDLAFSSDEDVAEGGAMEEEEEEEFFDESDAFVDEPEEESEDDWEP